MSKYGNKKVVVNGIEFASGIEGKRYWDLSLMEKAGEISGLTIQPRYDLTINDLYIGFITHDFEYTENNTLICEDVKGEIKKKVGRGTAQTIKYSKQDKSYPLRVRVFMALYPHIRFAEYTERKGRVFKKVQSGKLLSC